MDPISTFERLLFSLSTRFACSSSKVLDLQILEALELVSRYFDVTTATLVEMRSQDPAKPPIIHHWGPPEVPPLTDDHVAMLTGSWYHLSFLKGETVVLRSLPHDLPQEADAERRYCKLRPITANLTLPIPAGECEIPCALSLDCFGGPRAWSQTTVDRARMVGMIFATALLRMRNEQALRANLAEIQSLTERLENENRFLREEILDSWERDEIVGESPAWKEMLSMLAQVAPLETPVLLLGETGTGKELLARAIHDQSPRRGGPFVAINCAAVPSGLQESELFGHEKGAFTGAVGTKVGRLELADGGTLFLDEVGDMDPELQAKLLRVLQFKQIERIGGTRARQVDVRVVAATNRDLSKALREGTFRQDLYYRLSVFTVRVPPLRERVEDIPLLVWYFIHRRQASMGRRVERISSQSMAALRRYAWPGNVRELENVVERALVLSKGANLNIEPTLLFQEGLGKIDPQPQRLEAVDASHIRSVLERHGWKVNGPGNAAEVLGLNPSTLRFRMKKLGIRRPAKANRP